LAGFVTSVVIVIAITSQPVKSNTGCFEFVRFLESTLAAEMSTRVYQATPAETQNQTYRTIRVHAQPVKHAGHTWRLSIRYPADRPSTR